MIFFAIYLQSNRFVTIKKDWIEKPIVGSESKVFFSPNPEAIARFDIQKKFYLNATIDGCYDGFVYKSFGKWYK